jgi:hypothetical protein
MSRSSSLTDIAVRGAKPTDKPQKLFDGNDLVPFRRSERREELAREVPFSGP